MSLPIHPSSLPIQNFNPYGTKPRGKRSKYTPKACTECRRRKIKCTGMEPCHNCVTTAAICKYPTALPQPRGRARKDDTRKRIVVSQVAEPVQISQASPQTQISDTVNLRERLLHVENELRNLRSAEQTSYASPPAFQNASDLWTDPAPEEEENITCVQSGMRGYISLAIQIETLKNAACDRTPNSSSNRTVSSMSKSPSPVAYHHGVGHHSKAPQRGIKCSITSSTRLRYLLKLFFEEFNVYYPCVDEETFNHSLQSLLRQDSLENDYISIPNDDPELLNFAALACMVLAVAEFIEADSNVPSKHHDHTPPLRGQDWYHESIRLLDSCSRYAATTIDTLRLHMLEALYLLMRELFRRSSHALCRAVELSFVLGFNDEATWVGCTPEEVRSRRILWWTIYFFDRRLAYKFGRPYMIRDSEVSVSDFAADLHEMEVANPNPKLLLDVQTGDLERSKTTHVDFEWFHYLQFNIRWGRLFAKAWDTLYSLNSSQAGSIDEIEMMEALLAKLRRSLPPGMAGGDPPAARDAVDDPPDRKARMKLVIYTRANLLQIMIRNNLLLRDYKKGVDCRASRDDRKQSIQTCHNLAICNVQAVVTYVKTRRRERSFGTYATLAIVESLHYLLSLPPMQDIGTPELEAAKMSSLEQACECLTGLSNCRLSMASSTLKLLQGLMESRVMNHSLSAGLLEVRLQQALYPSYPEKEASIVADPKPTQHYTDVMEDQIDLDLSDDAPSQFMLPFLPEQDLDDLSFLEDNICNWNTKTG